MNIKLTLTALTLNAKHFRRAFITLVLSLVLFSSTHAFSAISNFIPMDMISQDQHPIVKGMYGIGDIYDIKVRDTQNESMIVLLTSAGIGLYKLENGEMSLNKFIISSDAGITSLDISNDFLVFATAGQTIRRGNIYCYSIATGKMLWKKSTISNVLNVSINKKNQEILVQYYYRLQRLDKNGNDLDKHPSHAIKVLMVNDKLISLEFEKTYNKLVAISSDMALKTILFGEEPLIDMEILDETSGIILLKAKSGTVYAVELGQYNLSILDKKKVDRFSDKTFYLTDDKKISYVTIDPTLPSESSYKKISYSSSTKQFFALSSQNELKKGNSIYDLQSIYQPLFNRIAKLIFSPKGNYIGIIENGGGEELSKILLLNRNSNTSKVLLESEEKILDIKFSQNEDAIAFSDVSHTFNLFWLQNNNYTQTKTWDLIAGFDFSPDFSQSNVTIMMGISAFEPQRSYIGSFNGKSMKMLLGELPECSALSYTPNGKGLVYSTFAGNLYYFNLGSQKNVFLGKTPSTVFHIVFKDDTHFYAATNGIKGQKAFGIYEFDLYNINSYKKLFEFSDGVKDFRFYPPNRLFFTLETNEIRIANPETMEMITYDQNFRVVDFSPNGNELVYSPSANLILNFRVQELFN